MKKLILTVLTVSFLFLSCQAKAEDSAEAPKNSKKDIGYALGVAIGSSLKPSGLEFDYNAFLSGMKDAIEKEKANVTAEEAQMTIQTALMAAMEKQAQRA
jgi:FKBP-type peptidyl-prolyl cis-trans isomerase FkpA